MKILHLTIKRKWFDLIATGEKKIEYRDIKQHWVDRLISFYDGIGFAEYEEYIRLLIEGKIPFKTLNEWYDASLINYDEVWFYNGGYCDKNKFPFLRVKWNGMNISNSKFNIHLGKIFEIKNWRKNG